MCLCLAYVVSTSIWTAKREQHFAVLALHKHPEMIVNMLFGSIDEEKGFYVYTYVFSIFPYTIIFAELQSKIMVAAADG